MTAATPESAAPGWEDYLEIFYAPARVFERRGSRWGGPLLVLVLASALVILGTYSLLAPLYEYEGQRAMAAQLENLTQEQRDQAAQMSGKFAFLGPVTMILFHTIVPMIVGLALWLVGKAIGATLELGAAMMVGVFSYFPRVLYWPILGFQAALLPDDKIHGFASLSFSPARFADATASVATLALLSRLDLFVLWTTALIAIGLMVKARVPSGKAALAGVIMWVLGTIQPLISYLRN